MRRAAALLLLLLAGCPASDSRVHQASWTVSGALDGARAVDDRAGGRVTCTVDADRDSAVDTAPLLTLAAVSAQDGRRQPALYLTVRSFRGAGSYQLGDVGQQSRGVAVVFDDATLPECAAAGDERCFQATRGCTLQVAGWTLGELVAPGVRYGEASGRFECERLENGASGRGVALTGGTFTCRASDWTATR